MKKNIFYIACGAMILAAAACSKEQANNEPQEESTGLITETLSAQKEDVTTKVTIDGSTLKFGWKESYDRVAFTINDGSGNYSFAASNYYSLTLPNKFTVSYTGTREGYAVTPDPFANAERGASYDGTDLIVYYPTEYSIVNMVDSGCYDNADGNHYIRFPMIAESEPGSSALTFYSIGALARVVVADVPKGTKKLNITFNKRVTGLFTVQGLGTTTPYVEAEDGTSTVTFTISTDGLAETHDITLYIPVPKAAGLSITASGVTKNTERNSGYQFNVNAIERVSSTTDFKIDGVNYILAPGNLVAHNVSGTPQYGNRSAIQQVVTTLGDNNNDPHTNGATLSDINTEGKYRDMFTWNQLKTLFGGTETIINGTLNIGGTSWSMLTMDTFEKMAVSTTRDMSNTIEVSGVPGAVSKAAKIVLNGSAYEDYAQGVDSGEKWVYGRFLFPDGYVDRTGTKESASCNMFTDDAGREVDMIAFDVYQQMVAAGAIFLVNGGYGNGSAVLNQTGTQHLAYVFGSSSSSDNDGLAGGGYVNAVLQTACSRNFYRSVRLVRIP